MNDSSTLLAPAPVTKGGTGQYAATADDVAVAIGRGGLRVPVRSTIQAVEGVLNVDPDPRATWVRIDFDAASLSTGWARSDRLLRGHRILHVDEYGIVRFESAGWHRYDINRFTVSGDIYVRELAVPVVADARLIPGDDGSLRFAARTVVSGRTLRESLGLGADHRWPSLGERVTILAAAKFVRNDLAGAA